MYLRFKIQFFRIDCLSFAIFSINHNGMMTLNCALLTFLISVESKKFTNILKALALGEMKLANWFFFFCINSHINRGKICWLFFLTYSRSEVSSFQSHKVQSTSLLGSINSRTAYVTLASLVWDSRGCSFASWIDSRFNALPAIGIWFKVSETITLFWWWWWK